MTEPIDRHHSIEETADLLGISTASVYRHMADDHLPYVKIGGLRRVPVSALQAWLDARIGPASPKADVR